MCLIVPSIVVHRKLFIGSLFRWFSKGAEKREGRTEENQSSVFIHGFVMDMMDSLSIKSTDSMSTSGEFEIVPTEGGNNSGGGAATTIPPISSSSFVITPIAATSPTLNIANNGDLRDLEKNLGEMIHEIDKSASGDHIQLMSDKNASKFILLKTI